MSKYSGTVSRLLALGNTDNANQESKAGFAFCREDGSIDVDKLLEIVSDPNAKHFDLSENWPNYPQQFGLTHEHVAELIEMVVDDDLIWSENESEVYAPGHAARALGQLRAVEALPVLLSLFPVVSDEMIGEGDWVGDDFPYVLALIGEAAIESMQIVLNDETRDEQQHILAISTLEEIGKKNPDSANRCKAILIEQLQAYKRNSYGLNGFIVSALCVLRATEAIELIREAHHALCVDVSIHGDLDWIEYELGFTTHKPSVCYKDSALPPELRKRNAQLREILEASAFNSVPAHAAPKTTPVTHQKIGRNDPCPCGSGKKYKKCCLNSGLYA